MSECHRITGGIGNPSKMPGKAYGLPTSACITGSVLRHIKGSVCSICYADGRGFYQQKNVQEAQNRRLRSLTDPNWVKAMSTMIGRMRIPYFRWHDSGDLQSVEHLRNIFEVCRRTKRIRHWLPTKEREIVRRVTERESVPGNLVIRVSHPMIGERPEHLEPENRILGGAVACKEPGVFQCPALTQGNACGDCRKCWSVRTKVISYHRH